MHVYLSRAVGVPKMRKHGDNIWTLTHRSGDFGPISENPRDWSNVELMFGRRRRRRYNIKPTLYQRLSFAIYYIGLRDAWSA